MSALLPEVAEAATFGVADFAVLMALLGLLFLRFAWTMTFHLVFANLARLFDVEILYTHPLRPVANALRGVDNFVFRSIGDGIAGTEHAWHKMLLWQAYVLTKTGDEIAKLSIDVLYGLHILHRKVTPFAISAAALPAIRRYFGTLPVLHTITRPATRKAIAESPALTARVAKLEKELAAVRQHAIAIPAPVIRPRTGAVAQPGHGTIVLPKPNTGEIDAALKWARGKIGQLSKLGTIAGIVGLTLATLGRVGLGWTRCSNVNKVGKTACGMNPGLLESLLADTLLVVGTVSLVEFAQGMQGIMGEVVPPVRSFWRVK